MFHVEHLFISSCLFVSTSFSLFHVEHFDRKLNNGAGFSPPCSIHLEKSHDIAFNRGGVPVFNLISLKPSFSSDSDKRFAAGLLSPPDSSTLCPMKIRPRNEVPLVIIIDLAKNSPCSSV